MYGYMIFGTKNGEPCDSFYVSRKVTIAIEAHKREFKLANEHIEMIVRSYIPYKVGSEREIKMVDGKQTILELGYSYSRCLNCMDFYKEEEIHCTKPFGVHGYESSCEYCIETESFVKA